MRQTQVKSAYKKFKQIGFLRPRFERELLCWIFDLNFLSFRIERIDI